MPQPYTPVRPKRSLGQHFLTDLNIARRIADTVDAAPGLPILEVGPGTGVLTQFLLPKGRPLQAVELDRESVAYLRAHFPTLPLIEGDFLRLDLTELPAPFVLTGNYPYNISSQIFFKMLAHRDRIPLCTGMIQREVAERLASPPGCKAYGVLSVFVQAWYNVRLLAIVPPTAFAPPPKVQSAVVSLTRNTRTHLPCDATLFRRLVKQVFSQRRKMLRVSLRQVLGGQQPLPQLFPSEILVKRPEQLAVQDFVDLTNLVQQQLTTRTP